MREKLVRDKMIVEKNKRKRRVKNMETDDHHHCNPYLPHEVVLDNILTRLRAETLMICSCVCKLWYNSIHHDPHFASSHFVHSEKNPRLIFDVLNISSLDHPTKSLNRFFCLSEDDLLHLRRYAILKSSNGTIERVVVGYCNGLICLLQEKDYFRTGTIEIFNPSRVELLSIFRPIFHGWSICYGFGFDSLTNEYKVVHILLAAAGKNKVKCVVFTLGTNSWREISSSTKSRTLENLRNPYSESAIFCDGALHWRTTKSGKPNKEVLVSFDLHDETFQVIQLPAECASHQQNLVHLLQYKGSLCVARLEKMAWCNPEVQLHILKDKVKQVWIKEAFDFLLPEPPRRFYNIIYSTRIVSFSDRILLYWMNDRKSCIQLYDLHKKHHKVVMVTDPDIFEEPDSQLNIFIENFISLKTFLPEGAYKVDANCLNATLRRKTRTARGFLTVPQKSASTDYYVFE